MNNIREKLGKTLLESNISDVDSWTKEIVDNFSIEEWKNIINTLGVYAIFEELDCEGYTASEYGEPGYDYPDCEGVVFANWNDAPENLADALEQLGYGIEWCDEWLVSDTGKAYRSVPNSYFWTPYFWSSNGEIIGGDDIEDASGDIQKEYVEYLINNPEDANVFDIDFTYYGFEEMSEEYQSGWYNRHDDPKEILNNILEGNPSAEVIFDLTAVGQFAVDFMVWIRR